MADAWHQGTRDGSHWSPLQGGEHRGRDGDRGDRRERHILVGVSDPSNDPARHRVFEVRASYDEAAGGWVARVGEQNLNEQFEGWDPHLSDGRRERAFATAGACLGDAVAVLVATVDCEAASPTVPSALSAPPPGASGPSASPVSTRPTPRWWPRRRRARTSGPPSA